MSVVMQPRDRLIPWYFVIFFVVVALVDGVMVTLAVRSFSGTVTQHPYEQGLAYNRIIAAEEAQARRGWTSEIDWTQENLTFSLTDSDKKPVSLNMVRAHFSRPTHAGEDFDVTLSAASKDLWRASVRLPQPGLWEIRIFAYSSDGEFQGVKRIVAP